MDTVIIRAALASLVFFGLFVMVAGCALVPQPAPSIPESDLYKIVKHNAARR